MAVASVASHGERHVNPFVEQTLEQSSGTATSVTKNASNSAVVEDTFTPSNQSESAQSTAQAAGIFQLSRAATTANAAPTQQGFTPNTKAPPEQTTPAATSNADPGTAAGASNANPTAVAVAAQPTAGAPAAAATTLTGTTNIEEQGQVQALNTELAALGLSNYDILQIDRIATVIQNFNPSAYTDLVNQFETQVQEAKQLTAPPPPETNGSAASLPAAANASAGTTASINLTDAQETGNLREANPS